MSNLSLSSLRKKNTTMVSSKWEIIGISSILALWKKNCLYEVIIFYRISEYLLVTSRHSNQVCKTMCGMLKVSYLLIINLQTRIFQSLFTCEFKTHKKPNNFGNCLMIQVFLEFSQCTMMFYYNTLEKKVWQWLLHSNAATTWVLTLLPNCPELLVLNG